MPVGPRDIQDLTGSQTQDDIEYLIEKWKPLLGLEHWKIKVLWDKPIRSTKYNAEIYVSDLLKSAAMAVNVNYTKWSDYWAETTIIHELLHCSHKAVDLVWEKTTGLTDIPNVDPALHPALANTVDDLYTTEMERFIDYLSCRIYDLYYK